MLFEGFVNEIIVRFCEGMYLKLRMEFLVYVKWFMNCFMVWSWEKCYYILKEYFGINNVEVSKVFGVVWCKLFEEDKELYVEEVWRLIE